MKGILDNNIKNTVDLLRKKDSSIIFSHESSPNQINSAFIEDLLKTHKDDTAKIVATLETRLDKTNSTLDSYFSALNDEIIDCRKIRKQDISDRLDEYKCINKKFKDINILDEQFKNTFKNIGQILTHFGECQKIQQIINISDEQDRQSFGL